MYDTLQCRKKLLARKCISFAIYLSLPSWLLLQQNFLFSRNREVSKTLQWDLSREWRKFPKTLINYVLCSQSSSWSKHLVFVHKIKNWYKSWSGPAGVMDKKSLIRFRMSNLVPIHWSMKINRTAKVFCSILWREQE